MKNYAVIDNPMKETRMKFAVTLTAALLSISLGATAQPIVTVNASSGVADFFVFNIDPNGIAFDTIDVTFTANVGTSFLGENDIALTEFSAAGTNANTDVLGLNTVAVGWTVITTSDSPTLFTSSGATLSSNIVAPVDFAQVALTDASIEGGTYTFNFADDGQLVDSASGSFGVPEPSSLALLGLGGLLLARRRRD